MFEELPELETKEFIISVFKSIGWTHAGHGYYEFIIWIIMKYLKALMGMV